MSDKKKKKGGKASLAPLPEFVNHRVAMFTQLYEKQEAERVNLPRHKITVTLPDGKTMDAVANETTPYDIAKKLSNSFAKRVVVAQVDGNYWDAWRPLEFDCSLKLCEFDTPEGKHAFWHSSAHVLGQALEQEFGCYLTIGPPLDDGGFYYDVDMGERKVVPEDYDQLNAAIAELVKQKHPFQRLVMTKEQALEMFKENSFKQQIIQRKVPDGQTCTAYRCGPLIDLCKGPHVSNTGNIKAIGVWKHSSAYWLGNSENPSLQRVYGMSFPDKKLMSQWQTMIEEAAKRDHRRVGQEQQHLFHLHSDASPGSAFFQAHGARIYNTLMKFIRTEYRKRGFQEVVSPNLFNVDLWKVSGHYENYKENMFMLDVEGREFGAKPMNCPGHCLLFRQLPKTFDELPLRLAEFGVLHRNELSGALSGLTRVRRFVQDDAHIFCRQSQIEDEIAGALDFLSFCYEKFGFEFSLCLSTRPEKAIGEISVWNAAEEALERCLRKFRGNDWKLDPGEGAFYGPKIDILLTDALGRKYQCATVQLDFQLPIRFDLQYENEEGKMERPVMIHRAILGSVERMFAVLTEHTGGKWPLWLSPRQVIVVPVADHAFEYAQSVRDRFYKAGFYADVDLSSNQFKKKIAVAQTSQYNFILVVGSEEMEKGTVNVRTRSIERHGERDVDQFISELRDLVNNFD